MNLEEELRERLARWRRPLPAGRKSLTALWRSKDWPALMARLKERFGVEVDEAALRRAMFDYADAYQARDGCDDVIVMWFKMLLDKIGAFRAGRAGAPDVGFQTELHVAFLYLEETEEMLRRLRNDKTPLPPSRAASSKVFTTPLIPYPIDSVAMRVAPGPKPEGDAAEPGA